MKSGWPIQNDMSMNTHRSTLKLEVEF